MDIRDTFAANLRKYRKAAKLSQEKLAEIAGLHRTYIGGIEQRRVNVSLKNIGRIANAMGIDPMLLFDNGENLGSQSFDSVGAWPRAIQSVDEINHQANNIPEGSAAVVVWTEDGIDFRSLEAGYEDLTIHVLIDLVQRGYSGSALAEQYDIVCEEIIRFLEKQG
ncbi:MAG: helix-turn-helix transcriptional regulator [Eggerthellaceae bacterium]|nr:helix-turn-helix transcriptional regulator [Eggerthellaceae bacterium]